MRGTSFSLSLAVLILATYASDQHDSKPLPRTIITVTRKTVKYSGLELEKRQATTQTASTCGATSLAKCSGKTLASGTLTSYTGCCDGSMTCSGG